jgi:hypothetical protein
MARKPLANVHPRRQNRSITLWRGAITSKMDDSLATAFGTMIEENISSLPVIDKEGKYWNILDLNDIVCFIAYYLFPASKTDELKEKAQKKKSSSDEKDPFWAEQQDLKGFFTFLVTPFLSQLLPFSLSCCLPQAPLSLSCLKCYIQKRG